MMDEPRTVAESHSYRGVSSFERIGMRLGRAAGWGVLRNPLRNAYYWLLFLLTGGRGLRCILPNGEVVRLLPRFRYATWNPFEYAAFREVLRDGDVAIDIGANVGVYALLFGQWVGPRGRVYAFEPAAGARKGLTRHIALNALRDVIVTRPEAITGKDGSTRFSGDDANGANRVITASEHPDAPTDVISVPAITLDRFCAEQGIRPALLKIDVEGAELDVLRGARETLRKGRGRLAVFVELHPDVWPVIGVSREAIESELDFQELRAVPLHDAGDPWTTNGECVRLVAR